MTKFSMVLPAAAAAALLMMGSNGAMAQDPCADLTSSNPNVSHFVAMGDPVVTISNIIFNGNSGNANGDVSMTQTCVAIHKNGHVLGEGHNQTSTSTQTDVKVCNNKVEQGTSVPDPVFPGTDSALCVNPKW